jgi:hypothetical protein
MAEHESRSGRNKADSKPSFKKRTHELGKSLDGLFTFISTRIQLFTAFDFETILVNIACNKHQIALTGAARTFRFSPFTSR